MSDSTFNADLDALVRGDVISSGDELTHFVAELYGEEQNVTMPNALKLRIANDLGLNMADDSTLKAAPVSRRTLRASEPQRRSSRPWVIAFAVAAAILLALTGVFRWGMPTGNDEPDNRFLFSSPAVPTVSATPEATPDGELNWMVPISPEECVIEDSGELPDASPEDFDAFPEREYNVVGPADPADANAATQAVRQYMACAHPVSLLSDRYATEITLAGMEFSPYTVVMLDRQLSDGIALSTQLEELGVNPADTVVQADVGPTGFFAPNPEMAFVLEDGRMLITTVAVSSTADDTQWAMGTTLILTREDGEWKVDDQVPVCIGQCDDTFSEVESIYTDALWLYPISAEECGRNAYLPNDLSIEESAAIRGRQYLACDMNGEAAMLQGPSYRVIEGEEAQPLSDEIDALHRQSGEVPGSLQRIATQQMMPIEDVPTDPWSAYQPSSVVMLDDGRVAVLETTVVTPDIVAGNGRTSPVITTALVWTVDGDLWLLDEEVTICLGDCSSFWIGSAEASPDPTVAALTVPEQCEPHGDFRADYTSHQHMPVGLRPGPGMRSGLTVATVPSSTPLQFLCETEQTSNPEADRLEEGQVWLKVRAEDGSEGWLREVDVQPVAEEISNTPPVPLTTDPTVVEPLESTPEG